LTLLEESESHPIIMINDLLPYVEDYKWGGGMKVQGELIDNYVHVPFPTS